MKPLFIFIVPVLTVAVYADQYGVAPVWYSEVPVETSPYAVAKPADKPITVPSRLGPLMPLPESLPLEEGTTQVVLGQAVTTVNDLETILSTAPPIARGAVEEGTIDPKLVGSSDSSNIGFDDIFTTNSTQSNAVQSGSVNQMGDQTDPLGYGMLLVATIITTIGLVIMAFVAYDYRQRWMQSMTTQNDRYLGGGFDMEFEDTYSSSVGSVSFSEGFGLPRRSL